MESLQVPEDIISKTSSLGAVFLKCQIIRCHIGSILLYLQISALNMNKMFLPKFAF